MVPIKTSLTECSQYIYIYNSLKKGAQKSASTCAYSQYTSAIYGVCVHLIMHKNAIRARYIYIKLRRRDLYNSMMIRRRAADLYYYILWLRALISYYFSRYKLKRKKWGERVPLLLYISAREYSRSFNPAAAAISSNNFSRKGIALCEWRPKGKFMT